jgi:hypothetical protein
MGVVMSLRGDSFSGFDVRENLFLVVTSVRIKNRLNSVMNMCIVYSRATGTI